MGNVEALGNQPEVGQVDALQAELEALRRENDALRAKEGAVNLSQVFQKAASFLIVAIARMLTSFLDVIITIVTWSGWKTGFNAVTDAFGSLLSSQPVQAAHGEHVHPHPVSDSIRLVETFVIVTSSDAPSHNFLTSPNIQVS